MDYVMAKDVVEAVALKAAGRTVLAGGTDHYPVRVGRPLDDRVVDITGISSLRGITLEDDTYRFGSLTRWADVATADLPRGFHGLQAAAREVGAVQIQNAGTIGGNLCTASPAADGVPAFLALDASVECAGPAGVRTLPLPEFVVGYRRTALAPDELVTAVLVPRTSSEAGSAFEKLGLRRYLVISVVMAAAAVTLDEAGRIITAARVAVGACSPVALRLGALEADLVGRDAGEDLRSLITDEHLSTLAPIDDVRASANYRRVAARQIVGRVLARAAEDAR